MISQRDSGVRHAQADYESAGDRRLNRRQFLAVTGLAAASGAVSQATTIRPAGDGQAELFKTIDFSSDGLNLTPREYSTLLTRLTASGRVAADDYCLGGLVEEIELKFAQLLG